MDLPFFRDQPNPLDIDAIEPRPIHRACYSQHRSFVDVQPVYATTDLDEKLRA